MGDDYSCFPHSSVGRESTCNGGDPGSIPGSGRSLEKGYATQSSILGLSYGLAGKESNCIVGDLGSIPELGRSHGEGKGYPLQYSGLKNSMDCIVHGVAKSQIWLSDLYSLYGWWSVHSEGLGLKKKKKKTRLKQPHVIPTFLKERHSVQFSSVTQSCPTLCDPMNHSMPGLSVHHQLPEFTQTHVHWVSDAIQPSHPLSSPSPPAPNPSQHQSLFQWVNSSHEVAKVLEFQL